MDLVLIETCKVCPQRWGPFAADQVQSNHTRSIYYPTIRWLVYSSISLSIQPGGLVHVPTSQRKRRASPRRLATHVMCLLTWLSGLSVHGTLLVVPVWPIIRHSSQVPASVHPSPEQATATSTSPQRVSGAELDSFVVLPLLLTAGPSPGAPTPKDGLAPSLSPCAAGSVFQGCLQDPVSDRPTSDFPDPPKRPPADPSRPLRYHHLISSPEQSPCVPYQEPIHHQPCPEHQSRFSMAFPAQ